MKKCIWYNPPQPETFFMANELYG